MVKNAFTRIVWVGVFAVAFALVEAAVVVYLRAIYYPDGLIFPLTVMGWDHIVVEIARESATLVMLASISVLAGQKRWDRFGFFLISFALWDIFYYVWLKVFLDWPASVLDWDVLFLIPVPWIGPVIAPVTISLVFLLAGGVLIVHDRGEHPFRLRRFEGLVAVAATLVILSTFMHDTAATLQSAVPQPFGYPFFMLGMAGYLAVLVSLWKRMPKKVPAGDGAMKGPKS